MSARKNGVGSIPACAGEPRHVPDAPRPASVYPRVCGGTVSCLARHIRQAGLSPRVRGNRAARRGASCLYGSIPACAGEPDTLPVLVQCNEVYPRVCGGTSIFMDEDLEIQGLSPRVRGNLGLRAAEAKADRSIPACAGEPTIIPNTNPPARVYPRVCGGTILPPGDETPV